MPRDSTPFNDILKTTLAATSSNSWPIHQPTTTDRSHVEIIHLWTTICNTDWSSPIRTTIRIHPKTTILIGFDCEGQSSEPSILAIAGILTPKFQYHQAPT